MNNLTDDAHLTYTSPRGEDMKIKLIVSLLFLLLIINTVTADTNTDIVGQVILKKNYRVYFDKGRNDGVAIGQRLDVLYDGRSFGSSLVSWVGDDLGYAKLDTSTFNRFYYIQPLEVQIYLESSSRHTGGSIHVPFFNDPQLTPSTMILPEEYAIGYLIYDNLVYQDKDGNIKPGLAHSWEVHGNTYTFYLNQNVQFHSGKFLDAMDVVHSLIQLAKAPALTPASWFVSQIDGYDEVHQSGRNEFRGIFMPNKYTIAITTKDKFVPFLSYLAGAGGFIIPALDRTPVPIGSGPFKVASISDTKIALAANPEYFGTAPSLDSIYFDYYKNYKDAALDFELGRLDLFYFDSQDDRELLSGGDYISRKYYTSSLVMLGFNCRNRYQDDAQLAKALTELFDRESIVRVLLGNAARASSLLIPYALGFESSYSPSDIFNPTEAATEIKNVTGLPRQLNLACSDSDPVLRDVADYLAGQMRHVGLKVNINMYSGHDPAKSISPSTMDLILYRFDLPASDPDALFYPMFSQHLNGQTNFLNYNEPQVERFLEGAQQIDDRYAREDIYKEAEGLILTEPPVIVLYNPYMMVAFRRDLVGFQPDLRAFVNLRDTYFQAGK